MLNANEVIIALLKGIHTDDGYSLEELNHINKVVKILVDDNKFNKTAKILESLSHCYANAYNDYDSEYFRKKIEEVLKKLGV